MGTGYADAGPAGGAGDHGPDHHTGVHHPDGGRRHGGGHAGGGHHPPGGKSRDGGTSGSGRQYNIIITVIDAATGAPEAHALCLMQFQPSLGIGFAYRDSNGIALGHDVGDTSVAVNCRGTDGTSGSATAALHADRVTVIRIRTA